jgi:flagellin
VESTDAASLTNLANAVNGGTGLGATYSTGTVANTNVTAAAGTTAAGLNTLTFTSAVKGLSGNSIATSSTTLQTTNPNTFAGSELTGGTAGSVNDLLTQSDAQTALTLINTAVATVAALRGNIGSTVNRLQSASSVINNQTQNLTSAENDVTAADIPSTVANLSQFSILEQTGVSALAQANQQQQLVLKLLQ